jgi:serine/threonine protein kinase
MGISRNIQGTSSLFISKMGTPLYLSPEIIRKQPFDFKVDMWGLGCMLHYLACLEPPFNVPRFKTPSKNINRVNEKQQLE